MGDRVRVNLNITEHDHKLSPKKLKSMLYYRKQMNSNLFYKLVILVLSLLSMTFFNFTYFYREAFAENVDIKRIAVLDFEGINIDEQVLELLADQVRAGGLSTISKDEYMIMTKENMIKIMTDMGKDASCIKGTCEVELARNIGADFVVVGKVMYVEKVYIAIVQIFETESGALLSMQQIESSTLLKLQAETKNSSITLFKSGLDVTTKSIENTIPEPNTKNILNGNGYKALLIPAGSFTMGCTSEQGSDCYDWEKPTHTVKISKAFYLMESEVTQALYEKVMGSNPSSFTGSKRPVEEVSWYDAVTFANKLSALEGREECYQIKPRGKDEYGYAQYDVSWTKDCTGWRLPTEAEWEYASRGGQSYKYAGSNTVGDVAWYWENSGSSTNDVCGKQKNGYGLCDMSGNVFEWVWDFWGDYSSGTQVDPQGPTSGSDRVGRGGSCYSFARGMRVSDRNSVTPTDAGIPLGFRLALTL